MYSLATYNPKSSLRLSVLLWLSHKFEYFAKRFSLKLNDYIAEVMEKRAVFFERQNKKADNLSVTLANRYISNLQKLYPSLQKLDNLINQLDDAELKNSFKLYKNAVYKYEAKLHRIITADAPLIETPEYLKRSISSLNKKALYKTIEIENAL